MSKHRDLSYGDRFPEAVSDALMEYISTLATPSFVLSLASATSLQIVAGTDNAQVGIGINGRWRYNSATVSAAHPGGAAGTYNVFVTASDNNFQPSGNPPGQSPENDLTVYSFGLVILPVGTNPTTVLYRQIGTLTWSGTAITDFTQTVGGTRLPAQTSDGTPAMAGTAARGSSPNYARADHVHPIDTSRAPLASPALTGTPIGPTAAVDTNTTQLATTAFVLGQAASVTPLMDGAAAVGTSTRYARADHVHPIDTSRAADAAVLHLAGGETVSGAKLFNAGPRWGTQAVSAAATLVDGSAPIVLADTTTAAFTLTLPAAPSAGSWFTVIDSTGQWAARNLTIGRNAKNIDGVAANLVLNLANSIVTLYYDGTGWHTFDYGPGAGGDLAGSYPAPTIKASVGLTGTPTAPTSAVDTNTTQLATTAFVLGQAAAATPSMDGAGAVGISTRYARADHVHPSDTTRAALTGATFSGNVGVGGAPGAVGGAVGATVSASGFIILSNNTQNVLFITSPTGPPTQYIYQLGNDGTQFWGSGTAGWDASLGRTAVGVLTLTGSLVVTSSLKSSSPTAGLGYATGAGGTVTQATSRSTAVTLNKVTGQVTTYSGNDLLNGQFFSFTVNNSTVAATDTVIVSLATNAGLNIKCWVNGVGAGVFNICYENASGSTIIGAQLIFNFAVIKAVTA